MSSQTFVIQPKTEGEKKNCPNCEKPMISRLAVYPKNPEWNKIIWQEIHETKAHYDNKGNCKSQLVEPKPEPETPDEYLKKKQTEITKSFQEHDIIMENLVAKVYTADELISTDKEIEKLIVLEHIVKTKFEKSGIETNVQKIGMYVKLLKGSK